MKPRLDWRHQDVGDAQDMGYLPRRAAKRNQNQLKREKYVAVNNKLESTLTSYMEMQNLDFVFLVFSHTLVQYFLPFGMVMSILCHCMLEACNMSFGFGFTRGYG